MMNSYQLLLLAKECHLIGGQQQLLRLNDLDLIFASSLQGSLKRKTALEMNDFISCLIRIANQRYSQQYPWLVDRVRYLMEKDLIPNGLKSLYKSAKEIKFFLGSIQTVMEKHEKYISKLFTKSNNNSNKMITFTKVCDILKKTGVSILNVRCAFMFATYYWNVISATPDDDASFESEMMTCTAANNSNGDMLLNVQEFPIVLAICCSLNNNNNVTPMNNKEFPQFLDNWMTKYFN